MNFGVVDVVIVVGVGVVVGVVVVVVVGVGVDWLWQQWVIELLALSYSLLQSWRVLRQVTWLQQLSSIIAASCDNCTINILEQVSRRLSTRAELWVVAQLVERPLLKGKIRCWYSTVGNNFFCKFNPPEVNASEGSHILTLILNSSVDAASR